MRIVSPLLVTGFALLCGCERRNHPGPTSTPPYKNGEFPRAPLVLSDNWTFQELASHLDRSGIKVSVRHRPLLNRGVRTAAALSDDSPNQPATVFVYRCEDQAGAHDQATLMGSGAFSNGPFAIGTRADATERDRELLTKIEVALSTQTGIRRSTAAQ